MGLAGTSEVGILIADSNRMQAQLLNNSLRRHPEFRITTTAMDVLSILSAAQAELPRVALLSPTSPSEIGPCLTVLRHFHLSHPGIAKVLLLDACNRDLVIHAFRSGARGIFCLSEADLRLLRKCILRVAAGQVWVNTEQLNYLLDLISEVPSLRVLSSVGNRLLTPREEQVVALVAEGLGNREIAKELNLSENTVKKYLFRVFEKLGISTRVELVLYAMNHAHPRPAEWIAGA